MKQLKSLTGGYPRTQTFLLDIQNELTMASNGILGSISSDVVLQGCTVTVNGDGTINFTAGLLYISGQIVRVDAMNAVVSDGTKAFAIGAAVDSEPLAFNTLPVQVKNVYTEAKAQVINANGGPARQLIIQSTLLTFEGYIDGRISSAAQKGSIREFVFDTQLDEDAFLAKFNPVNSLGITPDMHNWQIMDVNSPINAAGKVFVGVGSVYDSNTSLTVTYANGQQGGSITNKLSLANLPEFDIQIPLGENGTDAHSTTKAAGSDNPGILVGNQTVSTGGTAEPINNMPFIIYSSI